MLSKEPKWEKIEAKNLHNSLHIVNKHFVEKRNDVEWFYRPFHTQGSWLIRNSCALVATFGWLDAKIFKIFKNSGPIVSRY